MFKIAGMQAKIWQMFHFCIKIESELKLFAGDVLIK